MAYVEWHGQIRNHYKTDALMLALGVKRREAVGIIGCLSAWAIEYRPGGIIERNLIRVAVEWEGDEKPLIEALLKSGWVDPSGASKVAIHDWAEITRGYRKARADAARRKRDKRATDTLETPCYNPDPIRSDPNGTERTERSGQEGAPASGGTVELLASAFRTSVRTPLSQERAIAHVSAALELGVKPQEIEAAFMKPENRGRKIWDILDPFRQQIEVSKQPSEKDRIKAIMMKWGVSNGSNG